MTLLSLWSIVLPNLDLDGLLLDDLGLLRLGRVINEDIRDLLRGLRSFDLNLTR